jgi:Cof subfamily protein (haloacid dehalogenase superfamily)
MARFDLLAVDLDGTLFNSSRKVPEANLRALDKAASAGAKVAVVTGRRLPAALPSLRTLDIDPLLVFNSGALIKEGFDGPIMRRIFLSRTTSEQVLDLGREAGVAPIVHDGPNGEGHILIETPPTDNPSMDYYLENTKPPPRLVPDLTRALTRDPVQIGFASAVKAIRELGETIASRLREKVKTARTEYPKRDFALLDVLAPEATKAAALAFLAKRYGIPRQRTIAIGDNWNDLEMLEAAGFAVLMSNAPDELLSLGFTLTGSNDEAGVAQAIEKYVL